MESNFRSPFSILEDWHEESLSLRRRRLHRRAPVVSGGVEEQRSGGDGMNAPQHSNASAFLHILVTGCAGFIGWKVTEFLLADGHKQEWDTDEH